MIDLGSGDGRIVITAARQFGARGLGVEIVPDLVKKSRENAKRRRRRFEGGVPRGADPSKTDLSKATVVTLYLLPEVNLELRPKLLALKAGTRIVSHDWDMGDWPPERSVTIDVPDKTIGREKSSTVHLWFVPARLHGACGGSKAKPATLQVDQKYGQMRATLTRGTMRHSFDARVRGAQVQSVDGDLVMNFEDERMKPVVARNAFSAFRGVTFTRRTTDSCG